MDTFLFYFETDVSSDIHSFFTALFSIIHVELALFEAIFISDYYRFNGIFRLERDE